jgi:ATP-dependent protease HslVU (ClpYQ) peptidase subunit
MSVVACKITKEGYEFAADSITTWGITQTKGQTSDKAKLIEINGIIVGSVGRAEENSLFQLFLKTHTPAASTESAMLDFISEFSDWKYKKVNNASIDNAYIIGFENNVFQITGWYIQKITSYTAIGAGMDYALTALHLGHNAEEAVGVAIELCVYCENPIINIKKNFAQ